MLPNTLPHARSFLVDYARSALLAYALALPLLEGHMNSIKASWQSGFELLFMFANVFWVLKSLALIFVYVFWSSSYNLVVLPKQLT